MLPANPRFSPDALLSHISSHLISCHLLPQSTRHQRLPSSSHTSTLTFGHPVRCIMTSTSHWIANDYTRTLVGNRHSKKLTFRMALRRPRGHPDPVLKPDVDKMKVQMLILRILSDPRWLRGWTFQEDHLASHRLILLIAIRKGLSLSLSSPSSRLPIHSPETAPRSQTPGA
jgi:hypothetical protein